MLTKMSFLSEAPESNYLESKIATIISRVELFSIEFYGALYQWYNMN